MLHGYRQFMLKNFWFSSKMNATPFLLSLNFFKIFRIKILVISLILRDHAKSSWLLMHWARDALLKK